MLLKRVSLMHNYLVHIENELAHIIAQYKKIIIESNDVDAKRNALSGYDSAHRVISSVQTIKDTNCRIREEAEATDCDCDCDGITIG